MEKTSLPANKDVTEYQQRLRLEQMKIERSIAKLARLWNYAEQLELSEIFMRRFQKLLEAEAEPLKAERVRFTAMLNEAEKNSLASRRQWINRAEVV